MLHLESLHIVEVSTNNNFLVTLPMPIITSLYHIPFPLFTLLLVKKLEFTVNYEKKKTSFSTVLVSLSENILILYFFYSFIFFCKTKLFNHPKSVSIAQPSSSNLFTSEKQCIEFYTYHWEKKVESKENGWQLFQMKLWQNLGRGNLIIQVICFPEIYF